MSQIDLRKDCEKHFKKLNRKQKRDAKLQELERQLEFAESRCGTLKQQLDYIKLLYGCRKDGHVEKKLSKEEGNGDGFAVNQLEYNEIIKWNNQDEHYIDREDGDGPELVKPTASYSTTNSSNNKTFVQDKREVKRKNPKQKANLKLLKIKKKTGKKVKKRRKIDDEESAKVSNASSQTRGLIFQDPLVEIYKNSALNVESESGLEILGKNKYCILNEGLRQITSKYNNKQQEDKEIRAKSFNCLGPKEESTCLKEEERQFGLPSDFNLLLSQSKQNDLGEFLNKENMPKSETYTEPLKGYCQPTISSRKKQVERDIYSNSNLNNLNVKNIPFIAARSTTPSHNINVNIQQVLSIIKKRKPLSENIINISEYANLENPIVSLLSSRKPGNKTDTVSAPATEISGSWESKKKSEPPRTNLSYWMSNSEITKEKPATATTTTKPNNEDNSDWSLKVEKLKKVLVFLHQDFTFLSHKYKRLQKKLKKRNITKTDAKDELAGIERDLEKKEEEITVVIALYKDVLNLREELKKLEKKYNLVTSGKSFMMDGLWQSNSTHTQMTSLLRKIQSFQDKLKG